MPPPLWLMRQAGRYLPEYQAVRKQAGSFWTMCMTPELAVEVTLQPVRRFDFDAAILFSDILMIPHALGQKVRFEDGTGPIIEPLRAVVELDRNEENWESRLAPVYSAMANARRALAADKAMIGFAGAPWTLAAYMIEGRGTAEQRDARLFAYQNPQEFAQLLDILVGATARHLARQIESGADAVQVFDSWAGGLPPVMFQQWVVEPTKRLVAKLHTGHPRARVIGFPRGATQWGLEAYAGETGVDAIGIDTATSLHWAASALGKRVVVQGNLDPLALVAGGTVLERGVSDILGAMRGTPFIFNLGHGVLPATPVEHVAKLVELVRSAA